MLRQIKNMKQLLFSPLGGDAAGRGGKIEHPCHFEPQCVLACALAVRNPPGAGISAQGIPPKGCLWHSSLRFPRNDNIDPTNDNQLPTTAGSP